MEFGFVRGRADRVWKDAVVAIATEENRLSIEQECATGDFELAHAKTNRTRVYQCAAGKQPESGGIEMRCLRRPKLCTRNPGRQHGFSPVACDGLLDRRDGGAARVENLGGNRELT